jgi:hypothetical protein
MDADQTPDPMPAPVPSSGALLATISHEGRFWDVFLEFKDDPRRPDSYRGLLCFTPVDNEMGEPPRRTTTIIIEDGYESAMEKAKALEEHQLQGLLRSLLPDD